MSTVIHKHVQAARDGENPTVICRVSSGWMVLGEVQFLRGYSLLLPDPVVPDLTDLDEPERRVFMYEMSVLGEAIMEITDAYRMNYEILGNYVHSLHAHVRPRYMHEPDERREWPAWDYLRLGYDRVPFDYDRDKELMEQIAHAVQKRL